MPVLTNLAIHWRQYRLLAPHERKGLNYIPRIFHKVKTDKFTCCTAVLTVMCWAHARHKTLLSLLCCCLLMEHCPCTTNLHSQKISLGIYKERTRSCWFHQAPDGSCGSLGLWFSFDGNCGFLTNSTLRSIAQYWF